ncbi:hypothetical protein BN1723_011991, partial [Verticillium longisporum]
MFRTINEKQHKGHPLGILNSSDDRLLNRILKLYDAQLKIFESWVSIFWTANYRHDSRHRVKPGHLAALNGHVGVLAELIPTHTMTIDEADGNGRTMLTWAAQNGHVDIVQLLLDKGADVNAQGLWHGSGLHGPSYKGGEYGNALYAASCEGHAEIVQLLLNKGADVNAQGGKYGNALYAASIRGNVEIAQLLLDKGADANAQGGEYGNALYAASYEGHAEIVQLLLNKGADVNAQGGKYGNALYAASIRGNVEIAQLLLDKGQTGNVEIVQLLLDKGADVQRLDSLGRTPLFLAARGLVRFDTTLCCAMVTERDTINVASDEEERDGGERRQLRPRPKPSNKAIGNRATDNEAIEDEAIDNQATDNATDDAEVTKRRTKGRGTKSTKQLERQTSILEQVLGESQAQAARIEELQNQVNELKEAQHATTTEVQALRESIVASTATAAEQRRAEASYADVARMSPTSNARPSTTVAPPTQADTLFCTIDLSRIENEQDEQLTPGAVRILTEDKVRAEQGQDNWRCLAVTKDSKKSRIRIACRNEEELKLVKRVVESKLPREARMLRDDLYRVKVNYVKRTVVLDEKDKIRIDIAKQIGQENNVQIAKISWLSINGPPKEYGSMAVYLTKASDAEKLLTDRFIRSGPATEPTSAAGPKFAGDAPEKVTTTALAMRPSSNASPAEVPMRRSAEIPSIRRGVNYA